MNLPGALLLALLQRTPALRVAASGGDIVAASRIGVVARSVLATVATIGAVDAVAGATQLAASTPSPLRATTGSAIPSTVLTVTGAQSAPGSFRVTGTIPPGLSLSGLTGSGGQVNASSLVLSGTPTTAGTFTLTIRAWERANLGGDSSSNFTYSIIVAQGVPTSSAPTFSQQPGAQTMTAGGTVTFTSLATGTPAPTYQWRRDGVDLPGETNATLTLANVQTAMAGGYSVVATNSAGTATSATATLSVAASNLAARLSNLSVRTLMTSGTLIVGVVVKDGSRNILVRAAGPALGAYGLTTAMADPRLDLFDGSTVIFSNDNWQSSLASTFLSVGAFPFTTDSKDAALVETIEGARSIQARGTGSGVVLVEAYDTGEQSGGHLVNVSARNVVGTGDNILIAGFTIAGTGTKPLLIRAVGPKLGSFGVAGVLADPKLEVFSGETKLVENDDWQSSLAPVFTSVGAFALDANSHDAALLTALPPGSYTVQVRGADGGTGEALVEIYEVP